MFTGTLKQREASERDGNTAFKFQSFKSQRLSHYGYRYKYPTSNGYQTVCCSNSVTWVTVSLTTCFATPSSFPGNASGNGRVTSSFPFLLHIIHFSSWGILCPFLVKILLHLNFWTLKSLYLFFFKKYLAHSTPFFVFIRALSSCLSSLQFS